MDPSACYVEMLEAMREGDHEKGRERALALKNWIKRGGFYPPSAPRNLVDWQIARVLRLTAFNSALWN